MQPLVTIAIPTYNRADSYLPQSIKSALSQTYSNIEILVSDNCSTDNTESVVASFNDKRIRYFRQTINIGGANNSNFCLGQARGAYFTQLHDDNLIDCDFLEICLKSVNYSDCVGVIRTGVRWIDSQGNVLKELPNLGEGLSLDELFRAHFKGKVQMFLCSTLFNTERVREIGGFHSKHNLLEDVMADVKVGFLHGRCDVQEVKASHRMHDSEMTFSAKVGDWCEDWMDLIDLMCQLAPANKAIVRAEGMRTSSDWNYRLAGKIQSPLKRLFTYFVVFQKYQYKYLPPQARKLIYSNPVYKALKYFKTGKEPE